jgi:hypothetical protein
VAARVGIFEGVLSGVVELAPGRIMPGGCEIVACPSISETILGLTFFDNNSVAHVCRKEWKVKPESPAFSSNGLKPRW